MKPKKCKLCKRQYTPRNSMQSVCSPQCALEQVKQARDKAIKSDMRQRKAQLKTKAQWLKEAQAAFNAFVRIRDYKLPCISCGKPNNGNHQRHASHFRSVGAAPHLRFHLLNVHASCATCNSVHSGNLLEYVKKLPAKIGQPMTEWLMYANFEKRYSIEYAKRIKKIFTKRHKLYIKVFRST